MRTVVRLIGILVVVIVGARIQSAVAQSKLPASVNVRTDSMPMAMPQIAPLFIEGSQFSSEITVVNDVLASSAFTILIQDSAGRTLGEIKKEITGHSQQVYRISELLDANIQSAHVYSAGTVSRSEHAIVGTVEIIPEGPGIAAQLSLTYHDGSSALHTEEEFLMPNAASPAEYRGVAINVIGKPFIALKNTSSRTVHVSLTCIPEGTQSATTNLEIAPEALRLVSGCDKMSENEAGDRFLPYASSRSHKGSFGVSITSDANQDELSTFGFSWSHLPSRALTSIFFISPGTLRSSDTAFAGVAVGDTPALSVEPYSPLLALTNFSDSAAEVSVTEALTPTSGLPNTKATQIDLDPLSTKTVTLNTQEANTQLQNSILVQSPASPGAVVAKLVSATEGNAPSIEYQPKDPQQLENSGLHPWTIENGLQSRLFLFNFTAQDQYFNVKIYGDDKPWQKALSLKSMETRAVDIGQIIRAQEKDDRGIRLEKRIVSGELEWSTPGRWKGIGRILVSGGAQQLARNFSCGQCLVVCPEATIDPTNSIAITVDGFDSLAYAQPQLCWSWDCYNCGSDPASSGGSGYSYNWWSDNTSIASVRGATSSDSASFLGNALGGTYGYVDISDGMCDGVASGAVTVAQPSVSCGTATRGQNVTCTASSGPSGPAFSTNNWKFVDAQNNTVNGAGSGSTWSGIAVQSGTVSVNVNINGKNFPVSTPLTVSPRNDKWAASSANEVLSNSLTCADGTQWNLHSPPIGTGGGDVLGAFCADIVFSFTTAGVNDSGPNAGYQYVSTISSSYNGASTAFNYIVVADLRNASSSFYQTQCGTYNAMSNPNGYISGSQLRQNTYDHESGPVLSHYTNYSTAQNNDNNNLGEILERQTAPPGTSTSTFVSNVTSTGNTAKTTITTASSSEPCGGSVAKDSSQSCTFFGNINYSYSCP